MDTGNTKTVLITGGSKGIGFELSKLFARDGYRLILIARDKDRLEKCKIYLEQKYSVDVDIIIKDLSEINAAKQIYKYLQTKKIGIDVLVNNAGFGVFGEFNVTDINKELNMINLHIVTLVCLTKIFLKDMIKRDSGAILNIASVAGFQPAPLASIYAATKSFVLSFSEAVNEEIKKTNVFITTVCPGAVDTDFKNVAKMEKSKNWKTNVLDAHTVARASYNGLKKRERLVVPGLINKINIFLIRFIPRSVVLWLVKKKVEKSE